MKSVLINFQFQIWSCDAKAVRKISMWRSSGSFKDYICLPIAFAVNVVVYRWYTPCHIKPFRFEWVSMWSQLMGDLLNQNLSALWACLCFCRGLIAVSNDWALFVHPIKEAVTVFCAYILLDCKYFMSTCFKGVSLPLYEDPPAQGPSS